MQPVLEAKGLTKAYGGMAAIRDVSFAIHAGEILGYLGPNGSGKSTTVKMLAGVLDATTGTVLYRGRNISEDLLAYKRKLGYVPEEAVLYGFLSGWEYLEFVASLRSLSAREFDRKARSLLESFGLYVHRHSRLSAYSKGMRQRIVLIAALLHDPDVLLLDEPFSGLDITTSFLVMEVLKRLAESGKAIFFSSPIVELFERICTHVVLVRGGRPILYGSLAEVMDGANANTLETVFLTIAESQDASAIARNIVSCIVA
jgi:ABC-2 type transport system ATP-binding protein